eukprot:CAMPEP_0182565912 /NCGR_PEP_ID=MMETSP1324-20130603/7524_1 /TAXON_ID=236786 /ORGANISM="Florenciella sp., Strain RCC1587" /LENGTH=63 /DNA_ID=CAMNT_0024779643 /DNA_START=88 /DNA_END=276 /DNA_ORIENTATION=-
MAAAFYTSERQLVSLNEVPDNMLSTGYSTKYDMYQIAPSWCILLRPPHATRARLVQRMTDSDT